jgi:hypothetical protein
VASFWLVHRFEVGGTRVHGVLTVVLHPASRWCLLCCTLLQPDCTASLLANADHDAGISAVGISLCLLPSDDVLALAKVTFVVT